MLSLHYVAIWGGWGISVPKRKLPITAAVPINLANKKGRDWLIGGFLFGTELVEGQLNKSPCIML